MTEPNIRHGEGAQHYQRRQRRLPRKVTIGATVVGGLAVASLATTAAIGAVGYNDSAKLNTEYASFFEVGALSSDSEVATLGNDPLTLSFPAANSFVPGTTAQFSVDLMNNSPSLKAAVELELDGTASSPLVYDRIRISASSKIGDEVQTLLGTPEKPAESTVTLAEAAVQLQAPLEQRGSVPLTVGDTWEGPEGSRSIVTIYIHFLEDGALTTLSEGSLSTTLTVTGRSFL